MAREAVGAEFVESLKSGPSRFRDYKCQCRLYTRSAKGWKEFGGADYAYKQKDLFKASIWSCDYRNGSVVARDRSGKIRGRGGGALSLLTMTLEPDSRTLRLPTGYSLAQSDFCSLYDTVKQAMTAGARATTSRAPVAVKAFTDPVVIVALRSGDKPDSQLSEVLYISPANNVPLGWTTFAGGEPDAMVFFERLKPNVGLDDGHFSL